MSDIPAISPKESCLHWLWLSLGVIVTDLLTKYLALNYLEYADPNPLLPFFDLTLLFNTGAAFSFLSDAGGWQRWFFVAIAVLVSGLLTVWMRKTNQRYWWLGMGLALILGGAVGNLYDRIIHGYVVDFISLHYQNYFFPAFNLADTAITLGAVVLIFDMLFLEARRKKHEESNT
jgi:signal peptidase II